MVSEEFTGGLRGAVSLTCTKFDRVDIDLVRFFGGCVVTKVAVWAGPTAAITAVFLQRLPAASDNPALCQSSGLTQQVFSEMLT